MTELDSVTEQGSVTTQSTTQPTDLEEDTKDQMTEEKKGDQEEEEQSPESDDWATFKADGIEFQINLKERLERERRDSEARQDVEKEDDDVERYFIGELRTVNIFI